MGMVRTKASGESGVGDAQTRIRERADQFRRVREAHQTEVAEDYVELIYRLEGESADGVRTVDLVEALAVAQPTVTKTLERLQRDGLVEVEPRRRVLLTAKGRELAQTSLERHETIVSFLLAIGVPATHAELDAEGIEHHVSETTLAAMRRFLSR